MPDPSLLEMDDASLRSAAVRATLLAVTTLQRKMTAHADRLLLEHPKEVGALARDLAVALRSAIASEVHALRRRNADSGGLVPRGDGTRWSDEDHERFYRLVLKTYLNPSYPHPEPLGWDPLTLEERAELEGMKKRQLPLDPNDPLAAFNVPGLTAAYRAMLERKSVSTAEFHSWREYLLDPWKAAGYAVGFMAPGPDVPKEVLDKILGLDPLADSFKAFRHAAAREDAAHRE